MSFNNNNNNDSDYYNFTIPEPIRRLGLVMIKRERNDLLLKFKVVSNAAAGSSEEEQQQEQNQRSTRLPINLKKFEKWVQTVCEKCIFFMQENITEAFQKRTLQLVIETILNDNIEKLREQYDPSLAASDPSSTNVQEHNSSQQNQQNQNQSPPNNRSSSEPGFTSPSDTGEYISVTVNELVLKEQGRFNVKGVIVSISEPQKAVTKVDVVCAGCNAINEADLMPYALRSPIRKPRFCDNCREDLGSPAHKVQTDTINCRIIQVQDDLEDLRQDPFKITAIVDKDEHVSSIHVNDKVSLSGHITIPIDDSQKPFSSRSSPRGFTPVFYVDALEHQHVDVYELTEQDLVNIKRFTLQRNFFVDCEECYEKSQRYCLEKQLQLNELSSSIDDESSSQNNATTAIYRKLECTHRKEITLASRLASLFAPKVIGHEEEKLGVLLSAIGGIEDFSESIRGRIHVLFIGPQGTAKTTLAKEAAKLLKNSKITVAASASVKTLTAIVDVEGDIKVIRYGAIPLAHGALCIIDEIGSIDYLAQPALFSVMEDGIIALAKQGIDTTIRAQTTIIATANPKQTEDDETDITKAATTAPGRTNLKGKYPIRMTLVDRFDLVFYVTDEQNTEEDARKYSRKRRKTRKFRGYRYSAFLAKYIELAKQAVPKVTFQPEAEVMFDEYYGKLKVNPDVINSNRLNEILHRVCEAWARMYFCSEITPKIMFEVQTYFNKVIANYVNITEIVRDPYEILKDLIIHKLRINQGQPMLFDYTVTEICKENESIASILRSKKRYRSNYHLQEIAEKIKEEPNIAVVSHKPLTLVYTKHHLQPQQPNQQHLNDQPIQTPTHNNN